jgi:hypothetical protein
MQNKLKEEKMDRITKSLMGEFVLQNSLKKLTESEKFEHFSGFLVTSKHYTESFSTFDISVGAGGDSGIDSIAIIANGSLITEPEEIEDLEDINGYLDVTLVFTQSERSSRFESSKIGQFGFGVNDFLSEKPTLPQNNKINHKSKILSEILKRSSKFAKGNPQCYLYYVTTGKWNNDQSLNSRKNAVVKDLEDLNLFRKVSFECIGSNELQILYRDTKNAITKEIIFSERTVLPDLPEIEQAYLGLLRAEEFIKLIENSDEEIITSIFYDNVRHWQEWNDVNLEIKDTIENSTMQKYFPLFNNGVTIVAKRINPTGNRFVIEDFQIVNGCQTSYVLHETKNSLEKQTLIPVRLIATTNPEIRNSIIKATNRQTQVTDDQLFALSDFPKKLEAYFPTFEGNKKLYYERRSRQYNDQEGIEKVRVINMTNLVRSFAAIFLELPHRTTRNYKALLKSVGTEILHRDHRQEMYYLSAYIHFRLEFLFRSQVLPPNLKSARYHLQLLYRLLANPSKLPRFNSHEMSRYCMQVLNSLWDEEEYKNTFLQAKGIVEEVANGDLHRDNIRTEPFTEKVLNIVKEGGGKC